MTACWSHSIFVRFAQCGTKMIGCVPHSYVTLTNAWTDEWCLACPDKYGMPYCRVVCGLVRLKALLLCLTWFLLPGQTMMTPNMQGVIMAIGKSSSTYEKNGPEAAFFKVHTACPLPVLIPYSLHLKPTYLFLCVCFMVFSTYFPTVPWLLSFITVTLSQQTTLQIT